MRRIRYKFFNPFAASFFLFGADYPPTDGFSVRCRLRLKETPRRPVLLQQAIVRFVQVYVSLLVRVDAHFVLFSRFIGFHTCWLHPSLLDERLRAFDIKAAPDAGGFAWRKANPVTQIVDALADTIYPAVAECFVNRLGPGNARFARTLPIITDPLCASVGVMLLKPLAESSGCSKENCFHNLAHSRHSFAASARTQLLIFAQHLVRITIQPTLRRLCGCDHGMSAGVRMFAGVTIRRAIAAKRDSTALARTQMNPI